MSPAFSSVRQAYGYTLLLLGLISLPAVAHFSKLILRGDSYLAMPTATGKAFPYIYEQIFQAKSDLDVVFLGSSRVYTSIDPKPIRQKLSEQLGRPAEVITLATNRNGEDRNYLMLRDLLAYRRVKMVVLAISAEDFDRAYDLPYTWAYRFFPPQADKDLLVTLPLGSQVTLYAESVLGSPRQLLSKVRPNLAWPSPFAPAYGAFMIKAGYVSYNNRGEEEHAAFVPFTPASPVFPSEVVIRSPRSKNFVSSHKNIGPYQRIFIKKIGALLREHQVKPVLMYIPRVAETHAEKVDCITDWSELLGLPVDLVGVPPKQMFAGLSQSEIEKLFYDNRHFNANGCLFFTAVMTPAIVELYAEITAK